MQDNPGCCFLLAHRLDFDFFDEYLLIVVVFGVAHGCIATTLVFGYVMLVVAGLLCAREILRDFGGCISSPCYVVKSVLGHSSHHSPLNPRP